MQISKIIKITELIPYLIIGTIATLIDWSLFSILVTWFNFHYQTALASAYITAAMMHYISNKTFTFQCESKKIASQFSLYLTIILSTLLLSMMTMTILINLIGLQKIIARITTTILMILPNYLLHKHLTFNKKWFTQSQQILDQQ